MAKITHERLRELLNYDPETGVFTWAVDIHKGRFKAGQRAGSSQGCRYRQMWIDGGHYLEHRVAWFWMTGEWPEHQVDHKNLDGQDNRWSNLREATRSQNSTNHLGKSKYSLSGMKGVSFINNTEKCGSKPWKATIQKNGRRHFLGLFETAEEAAVAYALAAERLHGDFARVA